MFHGDVSLGDAEVFPIKPGPDAALPFPTNEIRVSHLSPASERCPPLAILQTIAPFSVRCKLQAKTVPLNPSIHRLYLTCFNEYKVCPRISPDSYNRPCPDTSIPAPFQIEPKCPDVSAYKRPPSCEMLKCYLPH
jgi:RNA polymerase II C-terminal domain phosphatase-like 1/2